MNLVVHFIGISDAAAAAAAAGRMLTFFRVTTTLHVPRCLGAYAVLLGAYA